MGKAPADQFYWQDWARDLEEHPLEIEGAWIRICCKLWFSETRGEATKSSEQWARILRVDPAKAMEMIEYISEEKIGDVTVCNKKVTVACRRMVRDEKKRKATANRVSRHREKQKRGCNAECNADVTPPSSSSSSSSKSNTPPPPSSHTEKIRSILPDSLPWNLWVEYRKHRRKTKGGMTEHAEELMAKKLAQFASQGYDPVFLVNETIEKGWKAINPEWVYRDSGGKPTSPEKPKIECQYCGQRHEPHVVEREGGKCPACGTALEKQTACAGGS